MLMMRFLGQAHGVNVHMVCPGWNYTQLFRYSKFPWYYWIPVFPIAFWFMRPARLVTNTYISSCITMFQNQLICFRESNQLFTVQLPKKLKMKQDFFTGSVKSMKAVQI